MGQLDRDGIPSWAVTMWSNDREIFVAIPMKDKALPPYVMSFPYNGEGLARALRILHDRPKEVIVPTAAAPANYTKPPVQPQVKVGKRREQLLSETTEGQRENALALIRKLGLVKS